LCPFDALRRPIDRPIQLFREGEAVERLMA
jgi:hypothetical protein